MAYLYPTPERQPYPVPTPIEHEPQVIDSKTLIDASVQDEMLTQERQRQQAEQQKAASEFTQMAREAALNALQRQMAGNIVAQKMNYRDALANGDVAAMDYANKLADAQRAQGNAIGWDGAGYGSDVSLEQAAQNLANNDARALANIFYNQQNSDDHYTMEIANLLDKGYSIDSAKRMAAQSADRLDRRNNAELIDSFATYGLDPRGVLTNNGVRILGELAQNGNSELANFYANMYAKPINEYNFNNEVAKMGITQNDLLERMAKQNDYATQARQENFQNSEKMAILNNSLGLNREIQLMQARIAAGVMQKDAAHQWLVNKYMAAGLDEQSANIAALTSLNGRGGKGATGGFNNDKLVTALQKERENAQAMLAEAEANGDKNAVQMWQQRIADIQAQIDSAVGMGGGKEQVDMSPFGDFDKFTDWIDQKLEENKQAGWPYSREQMYQLAKARGGTWADSVDWDGWYGTGGNEAKSEPAKPKSEEKPKPVSNVNNPSFGTPSGDYQSNGAGRRATDAVRDWISNAVNNPTPTTRAYKERYNQ